MNPALFYSSEIHFRAGEVGQAEVFDQLPNALHILITVAFTCARNEAERIRCNAGLGGYFGLQVSRFVGLSTLVLESLALRSRPRVVGTDSFATPPS